jgi:hypothetical protein
MNVETPSTGTIILEPTTTIPLTQLQIMMLLEVLDNTPTLETPGFEDALTDVSQNLVAAYNTLTGKDI